MSQIRIGHTENSILKKHDYNYEQNDYGDKWRKHWALSLAYELLGETHSSEFHSEKLAEIEAEMKPLVEEYRKQKAKFEAERKRIQAEIKRIQAGLKELEDDSSP